jgi:uncharacterized protein YndB with AHSA1/START domain
VKAPKLDIATIVAAPPSRVMQAFFEPAALGAWWEVVHAVTTPRTLGPYAVEWAPTDFRDDILGRLGGVFHGTVMQVQPGQGFFLADAYWLPPDGDPIGPMAFEVTFRATDGDAQGTHVRVKQSGFEEGVRWRRYYEVVGHGWELALSSLKSLLEK